MSQGIEIGAEKAGELIEYITETPIQAAKSAMGATVKVSGYVADWVGKLTKRMATNLGNKVVDPNTAVAPP